MDKTHAITLLAIDDKPDNLTILRAVVQDAIPQTLVLTATNGPSGIELAAAEDPDVILLDIVMPGMDGFEVCRRLKADERLQDIPVVFLTALKTDVGSRVKALEVGGEGFLAKPLETVELTAQIRAMTKVKAANRSQRTEKTRLEALVAKRTAELQVHQIELEMQNEELQQAHAKMDALLAQYTDLYDFAPTGYLSLDREGAILRVNLTGALLLGVERSRLDNRRFGLFVAQSDRRAFSHFLEKVFASESKTSCEVTLPKEGSQPLVVRLECRRSEDGQECRAAVLDITERKQAEEALRISEELLTETERIGKVGGWSFNIDTMAQSWTDEVYRIHEIEISPNPSVEQGINYYTQESRPIIEKAVQRAIAHGEEFDLELEIITAKGNPRAVHTIGKADLQNRRIHGFFQDITERKQAEKKLQRNQALLNDTGRMAHVGGWELDLAAQTLLWTEEVYRIHEVDADFAPSLTTAINFYTPESRSVIEQAMQQAIEQALPFDVQLQIITARGNRRWVHAVGCVEKEEGKVARVSGAFQDITERKRAEEEREKLQAQFTQAQKMESVGRLAGGVAHDFNNLLMGIMGYAELCKHAVGENLQVREWLDEITREAQRSANLTRQLLAFARKQTAALQVLDLNDAVGNMLKMLRRLIGEDIDLVWEPGAELGAVKIDPGQVDQILANLCVNARDAIGGAGKVTIETGNVHIDADYCAEHIEAAPGSYVMLAVSDDGCGMDHETLGNVFEPFFTTKGVGEGTGLGLATVYGIVKQNNGFINVYSEPGKGTTFRIYLPRDTSISKAATEAATTTERQGGTETILLVEDAKAIRITMRLFLERFGYTVIAAESPAEALRLVAEYRDRIDLLLTDVVMPGMSGRELAEKLAVDFPSMKVLYMSGYTANVIAHRGILDDGVQFIGKPIGRDALAQKVREVLG